MLKFLMYDLGIRQQFKPDMISLQVSAQTPHILLLKRKPKWLFLQEMCIKFHFLSLLAADFFEIWSDQALRHLDEGKK